jgi:uncharacterized protein YndB with AHSA1/START domain
LFFKQADRVAKKIRKMKDTVGKYSDGSIPASKKGIVEKLSLGYVMTFNRMLTHSKAEVWDFITNPAKLNTWLARAKVELDIGGLVELHYDNTGYVMNGKISRLIPLELIEYSWSGGDEPESLVNWTLKPAGDHTCILTLRHTFEHKCDLPKILSGWHVHLDMLAPAMDGKPSPWSWDDWENLRDKYAIDNTAV